MTFDYEKLSSSLDKAFAKLPQSEPLVLFEREKSLAWARWRNFSAWQECEFIKWRDAYERTGPSIEQRRREDEEEMREATRQRENWINVARSYFLGEI